MDAQVIEQGDIYFFYRRFLGLQKSQVCHLLLIKDQVQILECDGFLYHRHKHFQKSPTQYLLKNQIDYHRCQKNQILGVIT